MVVESKAEEKKEGEEEGKWVLLKPGQEIVKTVLLDDLTERVSRLEERYAQMMQKRLEADYEQK